MKTFNCLFAIPTLFLFASCQQTTDNQQAADRAIEEELISINSGAERNITKEPLSLEASDSIQAEFEAGRLTDLSDYDFYEPTAYLCDTTIQGLTQEEKVWRVNRKIFRTGSFMENGKIVLKKSEAECIAEGASPELYQKYVDEITNINKLIDEGAPVYFHDPQTGRFVTSVNGSVIKMQILKKKAELGQ